MTTKNAKKTLTVLGQADLAKVSGGVAILLPALNQARERAAEHQTIDFTYQKITEPWK